MMPTADMLLAVNLLLRAITACLAESPYDQPLRDWQGALHDRFRLPWFLRRDLGQVLEFLNRHGFAFEPEWFEPHVEFRFPVIAQGAEGGLQWTLRQAVEPWPVMGDHIGTGRVVDATTDRLEMTVRNPGGAPAPGVTVNGLRLPLMEQEDGVSVCGIRYRLFDNPWGLQPQVKAHSPLAFEMTDPATGKIIHAFDYLNWKREGGPYEGLPTTREEAVLRVQQRVVPREDKLGAAGSCRETPRSEATPMTLDLRRWEPIQ
jgi:uncharacterized protein (DUF2126 family)